MKIMNTNFKICDLKFYNIFNDTPTDKVFVECQLYRNSKNVKTVLRHCYLRFWLYYHIESISCLNDDLKKINKS